MKERRQAVGGLLRRWTRPFLLGAAALLAVATVAGAAIPDSDDGEIHACYQRNQGQLRVIDAEEGQTCHGCRTVSPRLTQSAAASSTSLR